MSIGNRPTVFRTPLFKTRVRAAAAIGLLCALSLPACKRGANVDKDTLVVALSASPNTLDPRFATDATGQRLSGLLFSSLVRMGPDLRVEGDAASSWDYDDKGKVYTFRLKRGLTFADGAPVTKEDIEFSFAQFMGPKSPFNGSYRNIRGVEARYDADAAWVKLRLDEFNATLLPNLSPIKFLPKARVLAAGDDFARAPAGSGPFRLVSRTGNEIRLEARPGHPYARPRTSFAVFKVIRDDNTRFLKTYKGEIDIVQSELPALKIATLEKKGGFQVFKYPGLAMTYLLVNLRDPVLKDLRARQAISRAIHREGIIAYKLEGLARPATSILTPVNPYFNAALTPPAFDPAAAREALRAISLSAAGAAGGLTLKTSNSQAAVENGKVLVHQLREAGLQIRQQSFEWGTFYGDIQKGNFQLATMRWVGTVDPDIYRMALHSRETPENSGRNRGRYSNPGLDRLLEEGARIADEAARIRHYMDVQRIVFEELPIIPLWYDTEVAVVHERVKGYEPPRNGDYSALLSAYKE